MLFDALKLLQIVVNSHMQRSGLGTEKIMIDNVAMAGQMGGTREQLNGKLVMSLVNLQEESTLKNTQYHRRSNNFNGSGVIYQNPPVPINLFILFSALHEDYETALKVLSRVIECFQANKEISSATAPQPMKAPPDVKAFLDLYSLTFEQLNHLWGSLGGKQIPFLLYRARLIEIDAEKRQGEGSAITEIYINE